MNTRVVAAALACALMLSSPAHAGRGLRGSYDSAVLGRKINFTIYLPDAYPKASGKLPVVYLLHGVDGDEMEWLDNGTVELMNSLIKRGKIRPTVAIMPSFGEQSWWTDGAKDKAQTALMQEFIPYVESRYGLKPERNARAVAGWSMGGYGALNAALAYPERFCAAGIISPEIYDPLPAPDSGIRRTPQFNREGGFDADLWRKRNYPARLEGYEQGKPRVPMWIVTGDDDRLLGLLPMANQLYARIIAIQPRQAELRVIDGELDWTTVRDALPDTLAYIDRKCSGR